MLLSCLGLPQEAQPSYESFRAIFLKAPAGFSQEDLSNLMMDHPDLVWPERGHPLERLKSEPAYNTTLERLLASPELSQRLLAFMVVAAASDRTHLDGLWREVREHRQGEAWAGYSLLLLKDEHTEELFDLVVRCDEPEDPHLFAQFLQLDGDSRRACALHKLNSEDPLVRRLAVASLYDTDLTPESERAIRQAIRTWPPPERGYAIQRARDFGFSNLKALLEPSMKLELLRGISLAALANSPSLEDQAWLESFIPPTGEIPDEVLDAMLESKRPETVLGWLELVRTRTLGRRLVRDQPSLRSDALLSAVQQTLDETPNRWVLEELAQALAGRQDERSVQLLVGLLEDQDSNVRYTAAGSLKGCRDPRLISRLPTLLRAESRTGPLVALAVQNGVDGLQDVFEPILQAGPEADEYLSAVQYLAAFPKPAYREVFRELLTSGSTLGIRREAARGLGNLHDASSLDLILEALAKERQGANVVAYLEALGSIKGEKARGVLETYRGSPVEPVRILVQKLLENW